MTARGMEANEKQSKTDTVINHSAAMRANSALSNVIEWSQN